MSNINYALVLNHLVPGASWICRGKEDLIDNFQWLDERPMPKIEEIHAAWPLVQEQTMWSEVRSERDALLAASDWTQVADAPVDAAAWAVYRQSLRDIPQDFNSPDDVVWPLKP